MTLPYEIVDVFTDRPFAGNPLAVVFADEQLDGAQMQALAREFNLSETVFALAPTPAGAAAGASYRARIFTPEAELPFAGHPSVGVAVALMWRGALPAGEAVQECGAGLLPLSVYPDGRARLTGAVPTLGPVLDPAPLLATAGLGGADLAGPAPRSAGCGLEFPFLPVRPGAVARAELDTAAARAHGVAQLSVFAWDPRLRTAHARVFVPGLSVPEDPATGSAALGLGVWLVDAGLLAPDGQSSYTVTQGAELLRPSTLECTVTAGGGAAVRATVTGRVARVARGEIGRP